MLVRREENDVNIIVGEAEEKVADLELGVEGLDFR